MKLTNVNFLAKANAKINKNVQELCKLILFLVRLMRIQLIKSEIQNMLKVSFRLKESEMIRSV